jgi:hypothetical protein
VPFARFNLMEMRIRPCCVICGAPAVTARPEADGTGTPFCAEHVPRQEEQEIAEIFHALNWPALREKVLH